MDAFLILKILCVLVGAQCVLIMWRPRGHAMRLHELVSLFGISLAFLVSIFAFRNPIESAFGSLLYGNKLFRIVISAFLLVALVVNRSLAHTKKLPATRKPECFLFLTMVCIWSFILWFSTGILITYLCLLGLGVTALFCVGLAFSDAQEGEALLKYWYQIIIAALFILVSLLATAVIAGDFSFKSLALVFANATSVKAMGMFFLLVLPYLLIGGLVPFHFNAIDRDHGAPWAVQMLNGLMVTGAVYGGLIKFGVELFGAENSSTFALKFLVCLGFVGTFWGLLGALTQENSKRRLAFFSLAMLSFPLMVLGLPSGVTVGASIFRFAFSLLALSALYWVLGWFHERVGGDDSNALAGVGRYRLGPGLLLLAGIGYFLSVPPTAGFSTTLSLFGAAFLEKSLLVLLGILFVSILAGLIMFRLLALVFFQRPHAALSQFETGYRLENILDHFVGVVLLLAILLGGITWGGIWGRLVEAASALIQLY